jgi:hypothetical protein
VRTYGILDVGLAALYGWIGFSLAPSRSPAFNAALVGVIALLLASGVSLLAGFRWARRLGLVAGCVLLGFAGLVIAGLVASAAYVRGIYGPLGRGVAVLALCLAALALELLALIPLFQVRFLLRKW